MKKLSDYIENISDDMQSTFTLISENQMINMLRGEFEFEELKAIIRKYLGDVSVTFRKRDETSRGYDVYDIRIVYPINEAIYGNIILYFLVYRNSHLEVQKVEQYSSKREAIEILKDEEKLYFEIVFCTASSLRDLFKVYPEYRTADWKQRI